MTQIFFVYNYILCFFIESKVWFKRKAFFSSQSLHYFDEIINMRFDITPFHFELYVRQVFSFTTPRCFANAWYYLWRIFWKCIYNPINCKTSSWRRNISDFPCHSETINVKADTICLLLLYRQWDNIDGTEIGREIVAQILFDLFYWCSKSIADINTGISVSFFDMSLWKRARELPLQAHFLYYISANNFHSAE